MLKNYFKIAFRNLKRNKSYTLINIAGLAVGVSVCMLIFIIIQFQTSFDGFHQHSDRTHRVLTQYYNKDASTTSYAKSVPFTLPKGIAAAFPQVEAVSPVWQSHNDQLIVPNANGSAQVAFKENQGVFFTTPSFFKTFDFPLLAGSYESLKDPNTVLLTKETAEKYFGNWKSAMGKTLTLEAGGHIFSHDQNVLKVVGVLATIPPNTDFQIKLVVAFGTGITGDMATNAEWMGATNADFSCYVLLAPKVSAENFNEQLISYSKKIASAENKDTYIAQSIKDIHYDTQSGNYSNKTISRELINVLWLIAAFILLVACVNFINLSTAQAVNRAKEVGVRKVLGSNKSQLQIQFLVETFLIVSTAILIAIVISVLALPYLNRLLELSLPFNIFKNSGIILFILTMTIAVTLLAGFYPSIVLSGFNPVTALKSKLTANTNRGFSLRRALVVFQFMIAQTLIIGTFIIVKQMDFFMNQPLGFDKDAIINIPFRVDSVRISRLDYLKEKLLSINGVQAVSYSSATPVEEVDNIWSTFKFENATKETDFKAIIRFADHQYLSTYKLALVAGRNIQPSQMVREFLVNESLVRSLGIKSNEEILNKELTVWGVMKSKVVGVLKDFNDRTFQHELTPLIQSSNVTMYSQVGIKLAATNAPPTLQAIRKICEETFPNFAYDYRFLNEKIESFYKQENQLAELYKLFATIAILLSCLGLYGLASFMAVQRIKEVGIRKVLGASSGSIVYLFSKEFLLLITIAFLIATPFAWYFMNQWLQSYVYRIDISWESFAGGGIAAIVIALTTISFQAVRAARANPVKSLRSE